jgi:hypothetical protein
MMQCCQCLVTSKLPPGLVFSNAPASAIGDSKVPQNRRLHLGVVFPESVAPPMGGAKPMYMFFSRSVEGSKVLEAACKAAGVPLDKGRLPGSPERLNLFTLDGDVLRVDLDLEAHVPNTLQPGGVIVLERGNRIDPERLAAIREAVGLQMSGPAAACAIM